MMIQENNLEPHSTPGTVSEPTDSSAQVGGFRQWALGHYRFLYAADLILLYLSAMFYMMARIVTGASSTTSRTLLVILIGSGIIGALPFVTGENFERDFAIALANPRSKRWKRIQIIVVAALLVILGAAVTVAIVYPTHHIHR